MHGRIAIHGRDVVPGKVTLMLIETTNLRVQADDQIATLWLDVQGQSIHTFSSALLDEIDAALKVVQQQSALDILLIRSAKPSGFGRGYDPHELASLNTDSECSAFAEHGQNVLDRLSQLSGRILTVALIDGLCTGAALEIAMACDYRIAVARPMTQLGFNEVQASLTPCWGGTQRLPRLVGVQRALRMLLGGEIISARHAKKWGLVDHVFCERRAKIELRSFLGSLQDAPRKRRTPRSFWHRMRDGNPIARFQNYRQAKQSLNDVSITERPAPHRILDAVKIGRTCFREGLMRERSAFAELVRSEGSRHALQRQMSADQPAKVYPEPMNPVPLLPETVGIVGGGDLGASLARWLSLRGRRVIIQEATEQSLATTNIRLERLFADAIERGWCTPLEAKQANQSIERTLQWNGFDRVGWAIESVPEDLGMKREVFQELEARCRPRVPIVSTSSTLQIEAMQAELTRPGRVAGLNFLTPFDENSLVEIARTGMTDSMTLLSLDSWLRTLGKLPVMVSDRPGRVVQRLLLAYLSEAVTLVSEGLPPDVIDSAMRQFGMIEGPLELLDRLGFDHVADLVKNLQLSCGDRFARNLLLEPMRALGWTGRGVGQGFYRYRGRKRKVNEIARMLIWRDVDEDVVAHYIFDPAEFLREGVKRLVLRTVNEAAACLGDEYSAGPATIDLAMTLGAGWAPHRGGPLRYADEIGVSSIVEQLYFLADRFGKRFRPCEELQERGEAGESFHGTLAPMIGQQLASLRLVG